MVIALGRETSNLYVTVSDAWGQAVHTERLPAGNAFPLNLDSLPPGMYWLSTLLDKMVLDTERTESNTEIRKVFR
ncbi:MAG: hypothetical protein H6558_08340 [Lewinellaceae bacterium]|nr:hypothetical protein [Lewinellaceae bacterium]